MIPPLHVVTDDGILSRPDFLRQAGRILDAGGESLAFHLRGPGTHGRTLHALGQALQVTASDTGSTFLINDRVDLALALDSCGVHLGQRSLPPRAARELLGPGRLMGLSVHDISEAEEGISSPVDFLMVGTIYPSPSHPGHAGSGVSRIRDIRERTDLPLLAIGGMSPGRVKEALGGGAFGVAVRGGVWDVADPSAAVRGYLEELERGRER